MMTHKAYKFRIYPNQEQQILITKTIGCSRFVFNRFLSEWNKIYQAALMDPRANSELSISEIKAMVDELIAAHGDYLPAYK